mmetsp:Transcript_44430/g.81099  ORF Transcript_44430/g.81099 Transcript_44430/m.81099 type:complete len:216 (-) Transcript_44430:252-899(-)
MELSKVCSSYSRRSRKNEDQGLSSMTPLLKQSKLGAHSSWATSSLSLRRFHRWSEVHCIIRNLTGNTSSPIVGVHRRRIRRHRAPLRRRILGSGVQRRCIRRAPLSSILGKSCGRHRHTWHAWGGPAHRHAGCECKPWRGCHSHHGGRPLDGNWCNIGHASWHRHHWRRSPRSRIDWWVNPHGALLSYEWCSIGIRALLSHQWCSIGIETLRARG